MDSGPLVGAYDSALSSVVKMKRADVNSKNSPPFSWGFLPAVSSHPRSNGRPQLASCFSLTNCNFTVVHQSAIFTSVFLLSVVPETPCLDSSSYVGLVQVFAGGLWGFDAILASCWEDRLSSPQ
ncbi:hypothetical protein XENOCAPTIV_008570 [Xenoophorus captivus]|uniref:Uncharacterized protein n=1 Tax=Xenoophorus captivus TaxID=1517983 RepID=A0ABV0RTS0_9TELE